MSVVLCVYGVVFRVSGAYVVLWCCVALCGVVAVVLWMAVWCCGCVVLWLCGIGRVVLCMCGVVVDVWCCVWCCGCVALWLCDVGCVAHVLWTCGVVYV